MGLTGTYNVPVPDDVGISVIKEAFNKGITFFDTSDIYGVEHANEILVGKVYCIPTLFSLPHIKTRVRIWFVKFGRIAPLPL